MTKEEFFYDFNRHWGNSTNQCLRIVSWELYKLGISKEPYRNILNVLVTVHNTSIAKIDREDFMNE